MLITFRRINANNFNNFNQGSEASKIFVKYTLFSYTFPVFIVCVNVLLSYYIDGEIGYGVNVCFVESFIQNIVTFIVPLLLTCVCNVIMFIMTITNIDLDTDIQKSRENRSELIIFTKLFFLTGSVWILQVIDSLLQITLISS